MLGRDCAGELEGGLVAGVSDPRTDGTHAEYALLPADQAAPIPEGLSPEEAASLCVTGISAYIALVETARVSGGHRVLVHAGAGGVGSVAIQIARQLGCEVFATASPPNHDYCRSLGAVAVDRLQDAGLHHRDAAVRRDPRHHRRRYAPALAEDAQARRHGGRARRRSDPQGERSGATTSATPWSTCGRPAERLLQLFQWATSGIIKPQVTQRFKPEEAGKGVRHLRIRPRKRENGYPF